MSVQETNARPRWRRILRGVALVAVSLFLIVLVGRVAWGYVEASRLRREISKIQAAGQPLTFKDLNAALPKVDERDDAGPYYQAAMALLRDGGSTPLWDAYNAYLDALSKSPASRPAGATAEQIDLLLKDNALTLDMLDRGAKCPGCRFDIGVENGMGYCLERLSRVRAIARLVGLRALVRASNGDADGAVDSLICMLKMLRTLDDQPVMICFLVKVACTSLASMDAKTVLETSQPSDSAMGRLQEAFLAADPPRSMERVMLTERVLGLEIMRDTLAGSVSLGGPRDTTTNLSGQFPASGFWSRPMMQHMAVGYLQDSARFVSNAGKPWPDALMAIRSSGEARSTFGQIVAPPLAKMCTLTARAVADSRCTAVAIMVERYRRTHGRLPETLADLVPEYVRSLPVDPFTGKDLLYRHDERSYVVYSVGEDQTDSGGAVDPDEQHKQPQDNGIRIRLRATG